jgi:2-dehydro-3-deoxy-D-gluconate 5-dehydrogenase
MNVLDLFRLDGKTALVTGCRRGIGKAMAVALAEAGADVIGVSAQMEPDGGDVGREIAALGRRFHPYRCDLADRRVLYALVEQVGRECPAIDILAGNAGMVLRSPAADYPDEMWDKVLEINLTSQFLLSREIGRAMLQRGRGKIIFTASVLTFQGGVNVSGYAASKGAIGRLTMALANEWAGRGVNVNAIAPGYVATDATAALRSDGERNAAILARIPAGRWATPEDFKGAVVFLASAASDYLHGSIVAVDGGWLGR